MTAAPVELDALPDAVGPAAEHHDPFRRIGQRKIDGRLRSATGLGVLVFVVTVVVRRFRLELAGAGIYLAEDGTNPRRKAFRPQRRFCASDERGDLLVRKTEHLRLAQDILRQAIRTSRTSQTFPIRLNLIKLASEPRIVCPLIVIPERRLQRAHRLQIRLFERAPDRHDLADRLHLGSERGGGSRELFEGETGNFHNHIIQRRLKRGRRLARNVVPDLVQRVSDRQQRGYLGDRKTRGLRRERGRARHARIHLDDDAAPCPGIDRPLHVRPSRCDADFPENGD